MIKTKKAETLVLLIISVFIMSFIILGITNLMIESKSISDKFVQNRDLNILKTNAINIIKNIDTSNIPENTIFYIYKNTASKTFETQTGSTYKYIDKNGDWISDLTTYNGNIYSRVFYLERDDNSTGEDHQVIRASVKKLIKK